MARSEALRRAWAVLVDLASDGTSQSIKHVSLSLDAGGEEVRWDVTVCIKLDFIVKSIRDSPRPSKTQGVPPIQKDSGRTTHTENLKRNRTQQSGSRFRRRWVDIAIAAPFESSDFSYPRKQFHPPMEG